jgi:hypothetical protein
MNLTLYFPKDICNIIVDYQYFKTFMDMLKFENTTYKTYDFRHVCYKTHHVLFESSHCTEKIHISPTFNVYCISDYDKNGCRSTVTIYKCSQYIAIFHINNIDDSIFTKYLCRKNCNECMLVYDFEIICELFKDNFEIIPIHKFNIYDFLKIKKYSEAFRDTDFMISLFSYFKPNSYVLEMLKYERKHI